MFKKVMLWVDRQKISVTEWLAGFTGVIFVRFFLEAYSNPSSSGIIASDASTLVHYWLFFLTGLVGVACILQSFTGNSLRAGKFVLFGSPILWLAPTLDLIISGGKGIPMGYLFGGLNHLGIYFFNSFLPVHLTGWTPGMRIEIDIILCLCGFYVWVCEKNIISAIIAAGTVYVLIFFLGALPDILYVLAHLFSGNLNASGKDAAAFLSNAISQSTIEGNDLHGTLQFGTPLRAFDYRFDMLMSQILFLILLFFSILWFRRAFPKKFGLMIKNCRPERLAFYLVALVLGVVLASIRGLKTGPFSWVDGIGILTLMLTWICAGMHAIHTNDIADINIDRISNPSRPLVKAGLTAEEMQQSGILWLIASLVSGFTTGYYPLYMILMFTACYYIYSVPPLRLKRIPILSSLLIAIAVLCTVMAGFFFLSGNKNFDAFPSHLTIAVLLIYTLGVNIRDIKDIEGDKAEKINTLPVLLGKHGIKITGFLFALSFALTPIVLKSPLLFYIMLPAALVAYGVATRKPYKEKWVFVLYFCVIGASVTLGKAFPSEFAGLLN